jgi:hypothetical protein
MQDLWGTRCPKIQNNTVTSLLLCRKDWFDIQLGGNTILCLGGRTCSHKAHGSRRVFEISHVSLPTQHDVFMPRLP